jgi:hypothetical protein
LADALALTHLHTLLIRAYRSDAEKGKTMIRMSVEVSSGAARFRVMVQAESIERAMQIANRHNPGKECHMTFPLDPETFFVRGGVGTAGEVGKVAA